MRERKTPLSEAAAQRRRRPSPRPSPSTPLALASRPRRAPPTRAQALALATGRRPIVNPNEGFLRCLAEFERELTGERSGVYIPQQAGGVAAAEEEGRPSRSPLRAVL